MRSACQPSGHAEPTNDSDAHQLQLVGGGIRPIPEPANPYRLLLQRQRRKRPARRSLGSTAASQRCWTARCSFASGVETAIAESVHRAAAPGATYYVLVFAEGAFPTSWTKPNEVDEDEWRTAVSTYWEFDETSAGVHSREDVGRDPRCAVPDAERRHRQEGPDEDAGPSCSPRTRGVLGLPRRGPAAGDPLLASRRTGPR
jgi:hypothetical protein